MSFKRYLLERRNKFPVMFHDENENAIVHDDGEHRISVNKPGNASHVVLWHNGSGAWKKSGELSTREKSKKIGGSINTYLSVNHIEIDKSLRGRGLGTKMYQSLLAHSGDHIKGIISHTPDRVNKNQVPRIYKKLGATEHDDYQVIPK